MINPILAIKNDMEHRGFGLPGAPFPDDERNWQNRVNGVFTKFTTMGVSNIAPKRFEHIQHILDLGILNKGVWLAGGAMQTIVNPTIKVKDYDLFFSGPDQVVDTKRRLEANDYHLLFECPNGHLFTYGRGKEFPVVQLITKFYYTSMQHVIDTFDIEATMIITDGVSLVTTRNAINGAKKKVVFLHAITFPVATLNRLFKYKIRKGFEIHPEALFQFVAMTSNREFDGEQLVLYID